MRLRCALAALFLGGSVFLAHAQEERLQLADLVAEALERNPEILAFHQRSQAAHQRPSQEGSLPDPVISPGYASVGKPWPGAGLGILQVSHMGLVLSQEFPFPGKRGLRRQIALKEAEADYHEYEVARLRVVAQLKQAYHRLQYAYAAIDMLSRSSEHLRRFLRATQAPLITIRGAGEAELAVLETRIRRLAQDKRSREAEINSLLNRPADSPLARPIDLTAPTLLAGPEELLARSRPNVPALRREQKIVERAELSAKLARRGYFPDYTISAGYFHMGSMPSLYELQVSLKIPLYFWRKQRSGVAENLHELNQARHDLQAANRAIEFQIRNEYLSANTSSQLAKVYAEKVIPQARVAVESSLAANQGGAVDIMSVLYNFRTLVEAELRLHEESLICHLALDRIEELTGYSIPENLGPH